jgi:hypothetical protein
VDGGESFGKRHGGSGIEDLADVQILEERAADLLSRRTHR